MGIFRQFPYTNFHDMNLDWILGEIKKLSNEWLSYNSNWEQWKTDTDKAFEELKNYVLNYFDENNISAEIVAYLDDLKDDGYFDEVINNLTLRIRNVTTNLVYQNFNDFNTRPHLLDGMCYIGDNKMAVYHSRYTDIGRLSIYDINTMMELSYIEAELFHGNSITYKDNKIYVCACFTQSDNTVLIPDIIVVDVSDIYNMAIVETIIPPLPAYSTGIYSLAYDPITELFYAICARGSTYGEFNRLIKYDETLTQIVGEIILPDLKIGSAQGVQLVYNGIAYYTYYDITVGNYDSFDVTTGKLVNSYRLPTYINNYRYIGELESICYDYDNDRWYGGSRLAANGVYQKTLTSIFELGITKNIQVANIMNNDVSDRGKAIDIAVYQGENTITTNIHRMVCIQDAINVCKNSDIFGIIYIVGSDLVMASQEICNFKGVIMGSSVNPVDIRSGIKVMNSDVRFTWCNFSGSAEEVITSQTGNIAISNSTVFFSGCTFNDQVVACDSIVTANILTTIYAVRCLILGSAQAGSTLTSCFGAAAI